MRSLRAAGLLSVAMVAAACGGAAEPVAAPTPTPPASTASTGGETPTATSSPSPAPKTPGEVAVPSVAEQVATGLTSPWGLAFLPDGSALVSERDTARVLRVQPGSTREVGTVPGVFAGGEGGLLGLAVAPTFADDSFVYAYATTPSDNRVIRMAFTDGRLGEPEVLLEGIPASSIHNGGRLAFGPDGMLYVTTGDASQTELSPREESLAGKILRLTPDGDVPPDNPDPRSPVWSSGHRNVQGITWDDEATLWASEFGARTWDELNRIEPGGNYGWPSVEGAGGEDQGFVDPVLQWPTDQASPSGVAFAEGTVYMAALRGQRLWAIPVGGGDVGEPKDFFVGELGRLRTVATAPDGSLWLVTNNTDGRGNPRDGDDRVLRLQLG